MFKKTKIFFLFIVAFLPTYCSSWAYATGGQNDESYISPKINRLDTFRRRESSSYLVCREVQEVPALGFGNFSFSIMATGGEREGTQVGRIGVRYSQKSSQVCPLEKAIEIGSLEIDKDYRRNGYGEGAIRTILGIFRSPQRSNLIFNRFWVTVGLDGDRTAARSLYSKVGFEVKEFLSDIGYQNMSLAR